MKNTLNFNSRFAKIYQQTQWKTRRLQIIQTLCQMYVIKALDGFQFYQDRIFNQQIRDKFTNDNPFIINVYGNCCRT